MERKTPLSYLVSIPAVLLYVAGFYLFFGKHNAIIGPMYFVTFILFARSKQVVYRPLRDGVLSFLLVTGLSLIVPLVALDPLLGLIINFTVIAAIVYAFFGSFTNITYFPIVLGYLYLITDVGVHDFDLNRLFAIAVASALFALFGALQRIVDKENTAVGSLDSLTAMTARKARELAFAGELDTVYESDLDIRQTVSQILSRIYKHQDYKREVNEVDEARISLTLALERILNLIQELKIKRMPTLTERHLLNLLAATLEKTRVHVDQADALHEVAQSLDEFIKTAQNMDDLSPEMYELIENTMITAHAYRKFERIARKKKLATLGHKGSPWERRIKYSLKPNRLRIMFSIKMAVTISLLLYITHAYAIEHGLWIALTIALLMRPYREDTRARARARVVGTVVATIIFVVVFSVVESAYIQLGLIVLAYLIYSRQLGPTATTIGTACFGGLGLMALATHGAEYTSIGIIRVLYVFVGIFISFAVGRLVLPYDIARDRHNQLRALRFSTYDLLRVFVYSRIHTKIPAVLAAAKEQAKGGYVSATLVFEKLVLDTTVIKHQISFSNQFTQLESLDLYLQTQHQLINDLHFLYGILSISTAKKTVFKELLESLANLTEAFASTSEHDFAHSPKLALGCKDLLENLDQAYELVDAGGQRVALSTMRRVVKGMEAQLSCEL